MEIHTSNFNCVLCLGHDQNKSEMYDGLRQESLELNPRFGVSGLRGEWKYPQFVKICDRGHILDLECFQKLIVSQLTNNNVTFSCPLCKMETNICKNICAHLPSLSIDFFQDQFNEDIFNYVCKTKETLLSDPDFLDSDSFNFDDLLYKNYTLKCLIQIINMNIPSKLFSENQGYNLIKHKYEEHDPNPNMPPIFDVFPQYNIIRKSDDKLYQIPYFCQPPFPNNEFCEYNNHSSNTIEKKTDHIFEVIATAPNGTYIKILVPNKAEYGNWLCTRVMKDPCLSIIECSTEDCEFYPTRKNVFFERFENVTRYHTKIMSLQKGQYILKIFATNCDKFERLQQSTCVLQKTDEIFQKMDNYRYTCYNNGDVSLTTNFETLGNCGMYYFKNGDMLYGAMRMSPSVYYTEKCKKCRKEDKKTMKFNSGVYRHASGEMQFVEFDFTENGFCQSKSLNLIMLKQDTKPGKE